jgi:hypothetical protein
LTFCPYGEGRRFDGNSRVLERSPPPRRWRSRETRRSRWECWALVRSESGRGAAWDGWFRRETGRGGSPGCRPLSGALCPRELGRPGGEATSTGPNGVRSLASGVSLSGTALAQATDHTHSTTSRGTTSGCARHCSRLGRASSVLPIREVRWRSRLGSGHPACTGSKPSGCATASAAEAASAAAVWDPTDHPPEG